MKATTFVCASAAVFASWLAVTYVREVSPKDYPSLGRGSVPVSASRTAPAKKDAPLISLEEKEKAPVANVK